MRAPFLFDGYFRRPDLTAEAFGGPYYRTGDVGILHEGEVYVAGRTKEMVIIHGKNVFAGDLEHVVGGCPGAKPGRCVTFGVYSPRVGSEELVVVVDRDAAQAVEPDRIRDVVHERIDGKFDLAPGHVLVVDDRWLVKSTSGKISREANRRKYLELSAAASSGQEGGRDVGSNHGVAGRRATHRAGGLRRPLHHAAPGRKGARCARLG